MSALRLETDEGTAWFAPGSTVAGDASWQLDGAAEAVAIRLFWYTEGKGTQDVEVVDELSLDRPSESGHQRFSFRLPEGPYSFAGKLIRLAWAIELVELPEGQTQRLDMVVGPTPVEVDLTVRREL